MAELETIADSHAALEQCGDLFRSDPVGCNMVTTALRPTLDFELFRVSDGGTTLGVAVVVSGANCLLTSMSIETAHAVAGALPCDRSIQVLGAAGPAAAIAGNLAERGNGAVQRPELFRLYRLGQLQEPSKRRKGKVFVSDRSRLDQAAEWAHAFGSETGLDRPLDDSVAQMEAAINESRLLEWRVKGEVVSQLLISPVRFGIVRVGLVYTPHDARRRGHAAAFTAAVAAQQLERQKVDDVVLNTQASNAATNRLYRRIGFESVVELLSVHVDPGPVST